MDKIMQTRLGFSCGDGNASVNIVTGSLMFEYPDIEIGSRSYAIHLSHVYVGEDKMVGIENWVGIGWKLNVQQYLLQNQSNPVEPFTYIDGNGFRHIFKRLGENIYYDTSGLGLYLTPSAGNETVFDIYDINPDTRLKIKNQMVIVL